MSNLNSIFFKKPVKKDLKNFLNSNILRNLRLFTKEYLFNHNNFQNKAHAKSRLSQHNH